MYNRFDFEQKLLQCWGIVDDINLVRRVLNDVGIKDYDRVDNLLLGIEAKYQVLFEELFNNFEESLTECNHVVR